MALTTGTRLGPYEVVSALGAGGMGEVYRAKDTKLGREVALKILPAGFAADPERLARFKREAQVLASLNHASIAHIYGFEDSTDVHALVLELVEGPTLAERIAAGGSSVDETIAIAARIAEALAAAHEKGIIHRDLKPANIKVGVDGNVKVLDFGLARIIDDTGTELSHSPTATDYTRHGQLLGTAAYMSPEQARGHLVDRRTDVWAFGCVLFEMLTGRSAFGRGTVSDTIAAVIERDPDWNALPSTTPPPMRLLLRQCLEKDVRRRRRDMADITLDLLRLLSTSSGFDRVAEEQAPARRRQRSVARYAIVAAVAATALAAVGWWSWRANVPAAGDVVEFTIYPPPGTSFPPEIGAPWPSISPDGRQLAFVALTSQGTAQLWVRQIGSAVAHPLAATDGAARPFWAPDSRSIGFFADGKIKRLDLANSIVQVVCDAPYLGGMSATWSVDDVILFTHVGGLFRVSAAGGRPVAVLPDLSTPGDRFQRQNPSFLPDGRHFLFVTQRSKSEDSEICIGSIDSQERHCILKASSPARYAPPGYLLFGRDGVLRLQRFDVERMAISGEARPASTDRVRVTPVYRPPPFSISANALAFHSGIPRTDLVWLDRGGGIVSRLPVLGDGDHAGFSASPDGRWIATSHADERTDNANIWVYDDQRGTWMRFTFDAASDTSPLFSPDGSQIVFSSSRADAAGLYVKATTAGGVERLVANFGDGEMSPQDWSSDGRQILYGIYNSKTSWNIGVASADGRTPPKLIINGTAGERSGRFSPNMKWIAYDSTESGRREVWIQPYPPSGDRWQVSTTGGTTPRWRGDGKELFYVRGDGMLVTVPVSEAAAPVIGAATPLFQTLRAEGAGGYSVSPDGRRFLIGVPPSGLDETPITVRLNWRAALDQR